MDVCFFVGGQFDECVTEFVLRTLIVVCIGQIEIPIESVNNRIHEITLQSHPVVCIDVELLDPVSQRILAVERDCVRIAGDLENLIPTVQIEFIKSV